MRSISIDDLDNINNARDFLMMLNAILLGWHKGADEIDIEMIKAACGELYFKSFDHISNLKNIG
ncbi:hypothetical protein GZ989_003880 [Campylobacter fetus]|uniref:hypothetical protein n=1 Tax=Campylobacter fetus TaxID=196 RepID=UPI0003D94146|nr:hypothetical protein [Campylobacter fetus]OCS20170.1 hypothetical protein CFVI97532_10100 [Campylobacter fetus subsp. venerealis cfvi97/532]OCS43090.1 hypothetical protein CFVI02298_01200 [Campylobacter fetus subsp. venerealis cfvi02/298]AHE94378.1 hypothetical protein CFVI03293_1073 [Campylobacter fetus subsp. venerealis cfvi03/293]EAI3887239.1 hypothetical protein [Campylobacter fetus]KAA3684807.1 hypothetical protein E3G72_04270 [Campylobacter fetus subsp. fetus]